MSDTETLVAETGIVGSLDLSSPVAPPPATVAHGDFTPWNALRTADGRIAIVDYERVGLRAPFTDAWHLATQAPALRGRVTVPGRLVQRIAREAAADPHAVRDWYRAYLSSRTSTRTRRTGSSITAGDPQLRRLIRTSTRCSCTRRLRGGMTSLGQHALTTLLRRAGQGLRPGS